jgi:signal transduction histidine kinase
MTDRPDGHRADDPISRPAGGPDERQPLGSPANGPGGVVAPAPPDAARRFRRRLLLVAVAGVVAWTVALAVVTGVATGRWGDLGLPTDGEGRPRGLMVIGVATLVAGAATAVAYRRVRGPVGDLLRAAEQVATGAHGAVDVEVRGPRELRLLTVTFNEMAARLAAAEEQRRYFLAEVTHELRNPLAVLQSEIEAQIDGVHPRDDHHLGSLLDETRRLGHLVDDLHTLALTETGRLVLRREAVAFGALVDEAVERHGPQARQRGVSLRASVAPDLPEAWVDPARVRQVVDNLVTNAVRHSPAGGEVAIEVATLPSPGAGDGPGLRCRVTDAGPGFPEGELDRVFERFTRAGDSRGSGLGLSIVSDLVRAHGGTVAAGNDPATGGASVRFTLPT